MSEIEKARQKAFYDETAVDLFAEQNIKSAYWANWWKVYGMGEVGSVQGCVYTNWDTVDSIPKYAKLLGYGMDFGFTNDPTSLVALWQMDGELYIEEICYRTGMTNGDIVDEFKRRNIGRNDLIVADCAEPKSIAEINRYGYSVQPCTKGADSINFGIDLLSQYRMHVTSESTNAIKELRNYVWETTKDGYNHILDALRYIGVKALAKQSQKPRGIIVR